MALSGCDYCRGWNIPEGQSCPKCDRPGRMPRLSEFASGINPGASTAEAIKAFEESSPLFKREWLSNPGDYRAKLSPAPRPSFDQTFMEIAGIVSKRATCPRLQVGSVITVDNRIIATGYNGSPAGLPHCTEVGCLFEKCRVCHGSGTQPPFYMAHGNDRAPKCPNCGGLGEVGGCKRTTHAEANALIQCARMGASPEGGTIYVTHRPCVACAGLIITAGIQAVWYAGNYNTDALGDEVGAMLHTAGVDVRIWSQ